jgi:hypothetical protein
VDVTTLPIVPAGATVTCSVEVRNDKTLSDPTCVNAVVDFDPLLPGPDDERGRCGHIGYMEWNVLVNASGGTQPTIINASSDDPVANGVDFISPSGNTLAWRTRSDSALATLGVIPPNETTTLTFEFVVPAGLSGRTFDVTMDGAWFEASDFTGTPATEGMPMCSSTFTATPVTLAHARVRGFDGEQVLEWTTATELSNVGFNVYAETRNGLVRVNDELIESQAVSSTVPLEYSLDVSRIDSGRFWIEEVAADGRTEQHGPFRLGRSYGRKPHLEAVDWAEVRDVTVRRASRRDTDARVDAAAKKTGLEAASSGRAALLVREDGVYRVTHEALVAAGYDFGGTQTAALALFHDGQPVPIRVTGSSKFGPGSTIEFFGEAIESLYTDDNVYVLANDRQHALRVGQENGAPGEAPQPYVVRSVVRENEVSYNPSSPTDDPWFETRILARSTQPNSQNRSYSFTVDGLVAGGPQAAVAVDVWGESQWPVADDHHVIVSINGFELADVRWDGKAGRRIEAVIPDGVLADGANTLSLRVPADNGQPWDLVNFDGFEVRYPGTAEAQGGRLYFEAEGGAHSVAGVSNGVSVYRIAGNGPVLLTGVQVAGGAVTFGTVPGESYAVVDNGAGVAGFATARSASDLLNGPSFDYLMVAHGNLIDGLAPLVSHHQGRGLRVKVVDVADVYASYSGGVVGPQAIRDLVRDTVAQKGVRYVLLVGADTYDYKDHLGLGSVSLIPTLYASTDFIVGYAPVDPLYGDVDGDLVPDVPVGRFPVRTAAELDNVVAKTLEYSQKDYAGTAVLAADAVDSVFSFAKDATAFGNALGYKLRSAYVDHLGVDLARNVLVEKIEEGTALAAYFGHSGPANWTFAGLFDVADANALQNYGKPTVVLQWGCWNTYHVEPRFNTLGHAFLLAEDRGAAAVLGSSTLLSTRSEQLLARALAHRLVEPGATIGDAVTAARQELATHATLRLDAILGWTILGDPALTL